MHLPEHRVMEHNHNQVQHDLSLQPLGVEFRRLFVPIYWTR